MFFVSFPRNKEMILATGILGLLEQMISSTDSQGSATALYLNLSCLEEAKRIIGSSKAVPFLTELLQTNAEPQCKLDALHALYNLSSAPCNIPNLLSAGIISSLQSLAGLGDHTWTEKCIAVLINLASSQSGRDEMMSSPALISVLATILDAGEPIEQEHAVSCLLLLCNRSEKCSQMVLQEGVIPGLVSISVNGTSRGKEKAQRLLMLFREQRQRDQPPVEVHLKAESQSSDMSMPAPESKPLCKSVSRRKMGKAFSFLWKSKSYSVYQC